MPDDKMGIDAHGNGALAYAEAVAVNRAFAVDRCADFSTPARAGFLATKR